jgi:hypothetical protein
MANAVGFANAVLTNGRYGRIRCQRSGVAAAYDIVASWLRRELDVIANYAVANGSTRRER